MNPESGEGRIRVNACTPIDSRWPVYPPNRVFTRLILQHFLCGQIQNAPTKTPTKWWLSSDADGHCACCLARRSDSLLSGVSGHCRLAVMSRNVSADSPGGLSVIVAQHSTESMSPIDLVESRHARRQASAAVFQSLVIPLAVVVAHVLCDRVPKRCPAEEDHPTQTFFLYGSDKSFGECVQIGRTRRQSNDMNALANENAAEYVGVFRISVENQIPFAAKKASRPRR